MIRYIVTLHDGRDVHLSAEEIEAGLKNGMLAPDMTCRREGDNAITTLAEAFPAPEPKRTYRLKGEQAEVEQPQAAPSHIPLTRKQRDYINRYRLQEYDQVDRLSTAQAAGLIRHHRKKLLLRRTTRLVLWMIILAVPVGAAVFYILRPEQAKAYWDTILAYYMPEAPEAEDAAESAPPPPFDTSLLQSGVVALQDESGQTSPVNGALLLINQRLMLATSTIGLGQLAQPVLVDSRGETIPLENDRIFLAQEYDLALIPMNHLEEHFPESIRKAIKEGRVARVLPEGQFPYFESFFTLNSDPSLEPRNRQNLLLFSASEPPYPSRVKDVSDTIIRFDGTLPFVLLGSAAVDETHGFLQAIALWHEPRLQESGRYAGSNLEGVRLGAITLWNESRISVLRSELERLRAFSARNQQFKLLAERDWNNPLFQDAVIKHQLDRAQRALASIAADRGTDQQRQAQREQEVIDLMIRRLNEYSNEDFNAYRGGTDRLPFAYLTRIAQPQIEEREAILKSLPRALTAQQLKSR